MSRTVPGHGLEWRNENARLLKPPGPQSYGPDNKEATLDAHIEGLPQSDSQRAWASMHIDFAEIDRWQAAGSDAHTEAPGSLLNVVDGLTEPHQSSHLIGYLLHTAVDHLHALAMLMENAGTQHTFAPYTLVRGAIESASAVLWILQDSNPRSVAIRTLKLEYANLVDQERAANTVEPSAGIDEVLLARFDECLSRNGLTGEGIKSRPPGPLMMIKKTSEQFNLPRSAMTWQLCSAAAHGRPWAKRLLTLFEAQEDDGVSKVVSGRLMSNEMAIAVALHAACNVVRKAHEVRNRYARNPSHTGASFVKRESGLHFSRLGLYLPC
jgi:hypothetical protein